MGDTPRVDGNTVEVSLPEGCDNAVCLLEGPRSDVVFACMFRIVQLSVSQCVLLFSHYEILQVMHLFPSLLETEFM